MKKSIIKAFTLVELLVVIAIVAILSTVGIMGYKSFTVKAYVSNDETKAELINRHLQIHQMDYPLNTEEDLKLVIDQMYGQEAFDKLAPQSAEYGYHYWFNIETKQVKLSRVEDLTNNVSNVNYLSRTSKFDTKNSFRANLVSGYMLLDRSGSAIADALSLIENIETVEDYELVIKNVKKAKNSKEDQRLGAILENALKSTTIIANEGTFRYVDVENVNNIYYTNATTTISSLLHEYDGKNVTSSYLSNVNNKVVATGNEFVLPSNITNIESYGLHFASSNTVLKTSLTENQLLDVFKANATNAIIEAFKDEIVNQYKIENGTLKNITSDTVVGTPSYSNPVKDGDFEIICIEDNNGFVKHNKVENILYVSYDQKTFNLSTEFLNDEVSSQEVTWTSSNSEIIEIDDNGKATINKLPEIGGEYEVSLRATALAGEHYEEITAYIVRPTHGNITLGDTYTLVVNNLTNGNTIDILYDGETSLFNFTDLYLSYNINDLVSCNENYEITTNGTIFDITGDSDNGYSLKLNEFDGTQTFTIKVGNYLEKEFTVNVIDNSESPFNLKFTNTDKYMYRLGNANEVKLSSLFGLIEGKNITNKTIKFDIYDASKTTGDNILSNIATSGEGFSASYTKELTASNWEDSTIKFNGSGVAILEIGTGNLTTRLAVEVIDGVNVTEKNQLKSASSFVLLNDIDVGENSWFTLINQKLNGNGFTIHAEKYHDSYEPVIQMQNAEIDNIVLQGGTFGKVVSSDSDFYNCMVYVIGDNNKISNSFISGGRAPIRFKGKTLHIVNSTLDGGVMANMIIDSGKSVILEDVTTIQTRRTATLNGSNEVMGLGIFVWENGPTNTSIEIRGDLRQYNWINKDDVDLLPSQYSSLASSFFTDNKYSSLWHTLDNTKYINLGIIYSGIPDDKLWIDSRTNDMKTEVSYTKLSESKYGFTGVIRSIDNSSTIINERFIVPTNFNSSQSYYEPLYVFNHNTNNVPNNGDGTEYCYYDYELEKYNIGFKSGTSYLFNPNILDVSKYGNNIKYNIYLSGENYTDKTIEFTTAGEYCIEYKYNDHNVYNLDGSPKNTTIEVIKKLIINVVELKESIKSAEFIFANSSSSTVKSTTDNSITKNYIMPNVSSTSSEFGAKDINGENIYYPIIEVEYSTDSLKGELYKKLLIFGGVTIKDFDENNVSFTYDLSTKTKPANLTPIGYQDILAGGSSVDNGKWAGSLPTSMELYNNKLCYSAGPHNWNSGKTVGESLTLIEFSYLDTSGKTYYYIIGYHFTERTNSSSGCVTEDTLITLANGEKVAVKDLKGDEKLLVWNLETGNFDSAPILFIDKETLCENEVIYLYFSDGTTVKVIYEHGFWNYNLNKYVYLDKDASQYIGDYFFKENNGISEKVQLINVEIKIELSIAYSPVTENHLCYFVNDMLSMPGGVGGLFNIFDVDATTMMYDYTSIEKDIELYGLFTYEELSQYVELSEDMFDKAGGKYLKISIAKGNLTMEELIAMIERYSKYF